MTATTLLTNAVLARVFRASKEVIREARPQLDAAVRSVLRMGTKKIKEFIAALPIFILFFRELLRQRHQVQAQKQLMIIGAAAALSTLVLVVLGVVLSSLPVQLLLVFTHPYFGIPLLFSEGVVVSAVMIVLVWLITYVLNQVLSDDPAYQRIRDEFLPPAVQHILKEVQDEIEKDVGDLDKFRRFAEELIEEKGRGADPEKIEKVLRRIEKRFRTKWSNLLSKIIRQADTEPLIDRND